MPIEVSVTDQNVQVSTSGQTVNASVSGGVGPAGPTGATGATGPAGTTTWAGITDKPATFSPTAHASSHAAAGSDPINLSGGQVTVNCGTTDLYNEDDTVTSAFQSVEALLTTHTHAANAITSGTLATARLASGTASSSTYLRGDQTWSAISTYTLQAATTSTLGGVIVGTGLGVSSGTASVTYGTTSGTSCQGNDSRLSDARSPTSHTHAASEIASGTIATARLGSGTASASTFLRGDGAWAAAGSTSASDLTSGTLSDARLSANAREAAESFIHPFLLGGL
jgi:hypothetical protein